MADVATGGLIFACLLDGKGGATPVGWPEINTWKAGDGPLWVHVDRAADEVLAWLRSDSGLTRITVDAVISDESRPRVFHGKPGHVAILRGINRNEGNDPEDMVALRLWCDGTRLITLRHRRLFALGPLQRDLVDNETGPVSAPALFVDIVSRLINQMAGTVAQYERRLDEIELESEKRDGSDVLGDLAALRKDIVEARRYMAPQREALGELMSDVPDWLTGDLMPALREATDRQQRFVEELDVLRERAIVIKDDIASQLADRMNRNMYVLSIIAAIFLPLSFFTGLLGMNVAGMPGTENPAAFWVTCAAMVVALIAQVVLFRFLKWI